MSNRLIIASAPTAKSTRLQRLRLQLPARTQKKLLQSDSALRPEFCPLSAPRYCSSSFSDIASCADKPCARWAFPTRRAVQEEKDGPTPAFLFKILEAAKVVKLSCGEETLPSRVVRSKRGTFAGYIDRGASTVLETTYWFSSGLLCCGFPGCTRSEGDAGLRNCVKSIDGPCGGGFVALAFAGAQMPLHG